MSTLKKSIFFLPLVFFFGLLSGAQSQSEGSQLADFLLLTQTSKDKVILTCEKGCEWEKLTFSLVAGQSQAVDERGLTTPRTVKPGVKSPAPPFLINITRTHNGLSLEGKRGTAWTNLSLTCDFNRCNQYISQAGIEEN
nr:hypothetical protein [Saprospiraceae bacterium]